MRYRTEVVREGERTGDIDWAYDFGSHFTTSGRPEEMRDAAVERLRRLASGGEWLATTDGGWPRCGWRRVLDVGMYDGWPYWRPVPSVCLDGPLGASWHSFSSLTDIELAREGK